MTDTSQRAPAPGADMLLSALEEAERDQPEGCMVLRAVRDSGGAITDFEWLWANPAAARALGMHRTQLYRLMQRWGLGSP
ncbi:hypothetical protein ACLESD_00830 [Pyxidicoccus sp. 3LFB2]